MDSVAFLFISQTVIYASNISLNMNNTLKQIYSLEVVNCSLDESRKQLLFLFNVLINDTTANYRKLKDVFKIQDTLKNSELLWQGKEKVE